MRPRDPSVYNGPIMLRGADNAIKTTKVNGTYVVNATTSGAGVIDLVFGNSPAVLNEWTTWQSLYHEYRVLGIELEYVPIKNVTSWAYGVGMTVVDRETSAALGSQTAAANHEGVRKHQMFNSFKRKATMNGVDEADWLDISSPVSKFFIKIYSSNNATIQTIGQFFITYLVEFRVKS